MVPSIFAKHPEETLPVLLYKKEENCNESRSHGALAVYIIYNITVLELFGVGVNVPQQTMEKLTSTETFI